MAQSRSLPSRLRALLHRRRAELSFALRATVAGYAAYLCSDALHLSQGYWSVLTAILVMQTTVGASVQVATERLAATVLGGAFGLAAAYAILEGLLSDDVALVGLIFLLSLLAVVRPAFKLAPVTAAVVLLIDPSHEHALEAASHRAINIAVGCLVALVVSLAVLPARAHADLAQQTAKLLRLLAEALRLSLSGLSGPRDQKALDRTNDAIRGALAAVEARAQEAAKERAAYLTDAVAPDALLRTLRRLRNDLVLVGRTTARPWPPAVSERLDPSLKSLGEILGAQLLALADAAASRQPPPPRDAVYLALDSFSRALQDCRDDGLLRSLSTELLSSLFTLGFVFEQLRGELGLVSARVEELAGERIEAI